MTSFRKYFVKIRQIKASDYKVVVLCVLAAATFWLLNALNKDGYNTVVDQPIEFIYDEENYMAVEELPSNIRIEINGNGWDLLSKYFQFKVTPYPIELTDPSKQNYLLTRNLQRDLSERIAPTQLTTILSDTLWLNIDQIVSKKIKVELDTTGNILAKNFRFITPINLDPTAVTVEGPVSIIEKLEGKIELSLGENRIDRNFSKLLPLTLPREYNGYLKLDEESVQVDFEVVEFLEGSKRIKARKVNFPANVSIEDDDTTIMMRYLVDERELGTLREAELEAVLNYNNRNRDDSTISVRLNNPPKYLESITFEPDKVKLIYE